MNKIDWEAVFNGWRGAPADDVSSVSLGSLISDARDVKPVSAKPTNTPRIPKPDNPFIIMRLFEKREERELLGCEELAPAPNFTWDEDDALKIEKIFEASED